MNNKIVILDDSVILYQHYISDEAWESVMAFPRGGLTYLIKNNNIKFYAYVDYFYRNCLMTMDLPIYIVDEELGIDGEYDDIQEITEILDRIFPSANGEDIDLTPYLKKREAAETYQPIGDYLSREDADTLYQPIGDYLSANSLVGYATEQWVENKGYIDKIKTINNQSLIGEGNIEISGGTADAYTKAEADERFQPIGDYVSRTTFITYISNLTQQIESLQEAIEECCPGSGETLYRWITLTGPNDYICSGTTKYAKEQKQQSTDNGATWQNVSPAEYRAGILIETDSPDCGYEPVIEYRWVTVSGEYVCSGTTKYNKEKKQYRVDGGAWQDTNPLQTRRGSIVIETQSPDCGYVPPQYRWWQAPASDYICSGTTKYYKEYYQVSYDGGITWQNVSPEQTRRGAVIESQSPDCGYIEPQYRWHQAPASDYICYGTTKYYKQYYQVSYDGGSTWQNVSPEQTRRGSVIEYQSTDCGYIEPQYRWYTSQSEYICSGTTKYQKQYYQVSYDGGNTWQNVTPIQTRTGSVIEYDSPDCGYVPTVPKYKLILDDSTIVSGACDSTSAITYNDTNDYKANMVSAEIGECVTDISNYTFSGCTKLTSCTIGNNVTKIGNYAFLNCKFNNIVIPNSVTTIGKYAFDGCKSLTSITIPNSVTSMDEWAFGYCSGATSINIGSGITTIPYAAFDTCFSLRSITIPDTVTSIGNQVFNQCEALTSATVGNGVTTIGNLAFNNCLALERVTIGTGCTSIGDNCFGHCASLESLTIKATMPPTLGSHPFDGHPETFTIYVPASSLNTYKTASRWSNYSSIIRAIP